MRMMFALSLLMVPVQAPDAAVQTDSSAYSTPAPMLKTFPFGAGDFTLRGVNPRVMRADPRLLANANTPAELSALERDLAALDEQRA